MQKDRHGIFRLIQKIQGESDMKKMVCEICGSQTIRKENSVFVCQECGTEYSVDEAKKLLQEVDEKTDSNQEQLSSKNTSVSGKDKLLNALSLWALNLSKMPDLLFWFDISDSCINTDQFWVRDIINISNKTVSPNFPKIDNSPLSLSQKGPGKGAFWSSKFLYDDPECDSFRVRFSEEYQDSVKSLEMAKRFYGKRCVISQIIEDEAFNETFQNKMKAFFEKYYNYLYDGYINGAELYVMFPSLIGEVKLIPGEGYVTERLNPKITELSVKYNSFVRDSGDKKLYTISKGIFKDRVENAPDSVTNTFKAILKAGSDIVLEFIEKHNQMMDYCSGHFSDICNLIKELNDNCLKLESDLFVPYKYRSVPILLNMIDLVNDGKATTWQDLVNLYDTHQYRLGVYEKLDAINSKLDIIQNTLVIGFATVAQQLTDVNSNLQNIGTKINSINEDLKSIKKYNFVTMWNSL